LGRIRGPKADDMQVVLTGRSKVCRCSARPLPDQTITPMTAHPIHCISATPSGKARAVKVGRRGCREQVKLAGLGDTSCGRSFALCPAEERCLRRAFPGGTVRTISRSRPGVRARDARRGCQGWPRQRRGHRVAARSVPRVKRPRACLDSPEHGASLTAGRAGGLSLSVVRARFADWNAFAVVASEATPAMENRHSASGILMHFHRRLHEVRTQRALRDL